MSEQNIISEAIRCGSEQVFEAFFRAEFDNVVFFVNRYIQHAEQAKDIAQESFIALWNSRERIDPDYKLRTYLYSIARNRACNYLRDQAKHRTGSIDEREARANLYALESHYIEEQIDALQLEQIIQSIYRNMPRQYLSEFRLSREEGMSYPEIAREMGISVKVVEYRIALALKYFRKRLGRYSD